MKEERPSLVGCMKGSIKILGDIIEPVEAGWEDALTHWDELQDELRAKKEAPGRE